MRVPNVLQGRGVLEGLGRTRAEIERRAAEISSGRRVRVPSDDPVAASSASRAQGRLSDVEQFRTSTDRAIGKLVAADDVLDTLERLMDVAGSAAAAGRSGTTTPEAFAALAQQVDGIRDEVLRLSNTRFQNTYLFAGRQTLSPAFTESGGVVSYQGDAVAPTIRVGEQAVVETSIPGSDLFVGTLDVFQILDDLRAGLAAEDTAAVELEAQNLEQVAERFTQFRVRVGLTLAELERHAQVLSSESLREQTEVSAELDANLVESISRFNAENTALEAAIGTGARLLSVSLLDVLG